MAGKMATTTDVRTDILTAAGPIFAELGFEKATVRDICRAASVNVAAVNYYFGDKQRLYLETVKYAYQLRSTRAPMPCWTRGEDPETVLRSFVQALAQRVLGPEQNWIHGLLLREVLSPTAACLTLIDDYFRPQMDFLVDLLGRLLPQGVSMARRRKVALSIVGQCMFYRVAAETVKLMVPDEEQHEHFSIEQIASHISELVMSGIQNCPASWITEANRNDETTETILGGHHAEGAPPASPLKTDTRVH